MACILPLLNGHHMIEFFMVRGFLFVVLLVLLSTLFFLTQDKKETRPDVLREGNSFIEGLRIVCRQDGKKDWTLTAKRADISENGDAARLTDIEMTVEKEGVTLSAEKGLYRMDDRNLTIDGKVVAKGANYSVTSFNGEFDNRAGDFKTIGNVRMEGRKFSVQGRGMNIDGDQKKVRILGDVKAVFHN